MSSFRRKVKAPESETPVPLSSSSSVTSTETENTSISSSNVSPDVSVSGWKPWIFTGQGIVSSGHRELDELLGGGLPLSSMNLYETEPNSNYGKLLLSYSIAEGLSHGHEVLLIGSSKKSLADIISLLPRNMKVERDNNKNSIEIEERSMKGLEDSTVLDEEDKKLNGNEQENELKIAWQYKKYIPKNSNVKKENSDKLSFCCSFDLSEK